MQQLLSAQFCLETLTRDVSDAVEAVLGVAPHFEVGWPTLSSRLAPDFAAKLLSVTIALSPDPSESSFSLLFEPPLALTLVERTLGSKGHTRPVHQRARLSEAEQGVFAFLMAKLARKIGRGRVIGMGEHHLEPDVSNEVLLSSRVNIGVVQSALHVRVPNMESALCTQLPLRLYFEDESEPHTLSQVANGDLLVPEGAMLTSLQTGLRGQLWASLDGIAHELPVRIEGTKITRSPRTRATSPRNQSTRFEIWDAPRTLIDAARLHAGESIDLGETPTLVKLGPQEAPFAVGELVRYQGKLAVRIDAVSTNQDRGAH